MICAEVVFPESVSKTTVFGTGFNARHYPRPVDTTDKRLADRASGVCRC